MNTPHQEENGPADIRVFLVDDDEQIQQALQEAIHSNAALKLVGQAYTLREAMAAVPLSQADVVLIDLDLPDGSGLEMIRHIQQHMPGCESMVLTGFSDESHVISSIEAGATGYLTKDTPTADILEYLKQLRAGGSPISPVIARRLLKRLRACSTDSIPAEKQEVQTVTPLSEREQGVLEMLAKGFTQAEIAKLLGVSVNTVSTYIKRIYKKLEVNSRTSAVHRANALGLIKLRDV